MLCAILQHCNREGVLPLLQDISECLFNQLDAHNMQYAHTFFKILQSILDVLAQGFDVAVREPPNEPQQQSQQPQQPQQEGKGKEKITEEEGSNERENITSMEDIEKYFKKHRELQEKEEAEYQVKDDEEDEEREDDTVPLHPPVKCTLPAFLFLGFSF